VNFRTSSKEHLIRVISETGDRESGLKAEFWDLLP
jgi:hypothetical protein